MVDVAGLTLYPRPTHRDTIPAHTGRAAQAWLLVSLRAIDPALSATIHDASQLKPFTARGLQPSPPCGLLALTPDQVYTLPITTLHPDLTRLALNALVPEWRRGITLHDQPFMVEQVDVECATYADLLARYQGTPPRCLAFEFTSPTVFKRTGDLQLPLPEYVFNSLIERWSAFAPDVALHPDLKAWILAHLSIDYHRIRTYRVSFERAGKGAMSGFVGSVTYGANRSERPFLAQLHALRDYAEFARVGAKTTVGMGQAARAPLDGATERDASAGLRSAASQGRIR